MTDKPWPEEMLERLNRAAATVSTEPVGFGEATLNAITPADLAIIAERLGYQVISNEQLVSINNDALERAAIQADIWAQAGASIIGPAHGAGMNKAAEIIARAIRTLKAPLPEERP